MSVLARAAALPALLLLAVQFPASAQTPPTARGEIQGRVVSAAGETPLSLATVAVLGPGSTALAARTTSAGDGAFQVKGLKIGRYRLRILAVGHAAKELPVSIGAAILMALILQGE